MVILREFQSDFWENLTEFNQISLKNFGLSHRFQSTDYGMYVFFENYNPTPLDMYNGLSQVYCINPDGRIH